MFQAVIVWQNSDVHVVHEYNSIYDKYLAGMFSFTRRFQDWLNFHKPLIMPEPFEWNTILNPYLSQATDHALNLYVTAASKFDSPLLDFLA